MAAKLEWDGDRLRLGGEDGWILAQLRNEGGYWSFVLNRTDGRRPNYERKQDARNDCTDAVRRLLKEAGVEVVP